MKVEITSQKNLARPRSGFKAFDLRRHIIVLGNPFLSTKSLFSRYNIDVSSMSVDEAQDQSMSEFRLVHSGGSRRAFGEAEKYLLCRLRAADKWLASYLPRDNAGDRRMTIVGLDSVAELDSGELLLRSPRAPHQPSVRLSDDFGQIKLMSGRNIKITSALKVTSLAEDPGFYWGEEEIMSFRMRIPHMSNTQISAYISSDEYSSRSQEPIIFPPNHAWIHHSRDDDSPRPIESRQEFDPGGSSLSLDVFESSMLKLQE